MRQHSRRDMEVPSWKADDCAEVYTLESVLRTDAT